MKKILAIMIAILMVLTLTIPAASALNTNVHVITITNADPAKAHIYKAYRVFEGRLDTTDNVLADISWSNGVNSTTLLAALKETADFANCENAKDVAEVIKGYGDNSEKLDAFAKIVGEHLGNSAGTTTAINTTSPYTINVVGDGYYFVKDKNDSVQSAGESYTKYILNVVHDVTIEAKDDHLVPEKKIVEYNSLVSSNSASIGDDVKFQISIDIPKMDGYKAYTFTMNDTLSKGLEFKNLTSVMVGTKNLTNNVDYTLSTVKNADGTTTLTVDFKDFIQYKNTTGKVTVNYLATVDEDAVIGVEGNPNTVDFTYSNNPASTGEGEPGSTGTTPKSTTITYTTGIEILKVDGTSQKALEGAKFVIEGAGVKTIITTGTKYEKAPYAAADGETVDPETYYLLDDGTYTTTQPTPVPADSYVLVHFKKVTTNSATVDCEGTTGTDGKTNFNGLNAGTYTLTEIEAPDGYNLLEAPIEFGITWSEADGFAVAANDQSGVVYDSTTGTFKITVENNKGSVLPHTGGIGSTIFFVLGSILILAAGISLVTVLIVKRREKK